MDLHSVEELIWKALYSEKVAESYIPRFENPLAVLVYFDASIFVLFELYDNSCQELEAQHQRSKEMPGQPACHSNRTKSEKGSSTGKNDSAGWVPDQSDGNQFKT
jgi:hypothetical protein